MGVDDVPVDKKGGSSLFWDRRGGPEVAFELTRSLCKRVHEAAYAAARAS
jgi:hypothetical protein